MAKRVEIAGAAVAAGERRVVRLPVTVDLDGGEIAVTVHVVAGARPGPTLLLTGIQHGDEWQELELFRRLVATVSPEELAGTLLVVPVCSPIALGQLTRITQASSDGPDLNRVFPGKFHWIPEQTARLISRELLPLADAIVDFHFGIWGTGIGFVAYGGDFPDPDVSRRSRELALAYGHDLIQRGSFMGGFPGPSSLISYAGAHLGKPGLVGEIGVAGYGRAIEDRWLEVNLRGVRGVMRHLGMLEGAVSRPARTLVFEAGHRIEPTRGGLLLPTHERDEPGRAVRRGEVLARVISPYSFEELEQLVAPCDGVLTLAARSYMVRPGDWAFGVADTEAATSEWIDAHGA